jgi:hypothetical protein
MDAVGAPAGERFRDPAWRLWRFVEEILATIGTLHAL